MTDEETLRDLTRKLKANREKVPREILTTKYKKPYEELKDRIAATMKRMVADKAFAGIKVRSDEAGNAIVAQVQEIVGETMPEISAAIFKRYDVDEFGEKVDNLRTAVWNQWIPYWQSFCGLYAAPECFEEPFPAPKIYNDLTGEFLVDEKTDTWEKRPEWETEKRCFITAGACHVMAQALREKEEKNNGQTVKH